MKFDPLRKRKAADEFELAWVLETELEKDMPMGNVVASHLNHVVALTLVGYGATVAPVLPKFINWLKDAIEKNEELGRNINFHHRKLNWALAIYVWLTELGTCHEAWERARLCDKAAEADGVYDHKELSSSRLDDYMAFCLLAEQYAEGVAEFEKYAKDRELMRKSTLQPRELAYLICLARIGRDSDTQGINAAGHKMLRANLQEWLSYGAYTRAATWLKIVISQNDPAKSPIETILSAYDYMPDTAKPSFLVE